jgi:cell division protein FtsB
VTSRRMPSGQGPTRRPTAGAVRNTGSVRRTGAARTTSARVPRERGARPALNRRTVTVAAGPAKRTAAPRPRAMTGRATVLIVVFVTLALAYTYPLRVYLAQKSEIAQMMADQAAQRQRIAQKSVDLAKWQDPEYVKAQARAKYFYVTPGETPLVVINDPAGAALDAGHKMPAAAPGRWYDTLWSSVRAADAESPR